MRCITPMVRFYNLVPDLQEGEKVAQKILSRRKVFENLQEDENYLSRIQNKNEELEAKGIPWRYQLIGCQNCWACQLKKAAEWATRIMWECKEHEHNYFITLTYDEEHLPLYNKMIYTDENGETTTYENDGTWTGTLQPEDVTKFIKTLRKHFEREGITGIKYFYCGEYGNEGQNGNMGYRPHYHMILMGAPLDIDTFYSWKHDNKQHKLHWKCKQLENWWQKGFIDVAEVEWNCAAYVARYCMKKIDNNNDPRKYAEVGKQKEFIRMSRNPGIGMKYYKEHRNEIYDLDGVAVKTIKNKTTWLKPPAAFDRKLKEEKPELYEKIKESRIAAAERDRKYKEELIKGISDKEQLQREAEKVIQKGKLLKRITQFE